MHQIIKDAIKYAWTMVGIPYRWGGDDPMAGYDCSGEVVEILQAAGIFQDGEDHTAESMREYFPVKQIIIPGCLLFKMKNGVAYHVGIAVSWNTVIQAGGGGRGVVSLEDAIAADAFIKPRPVWTGPNIEIRDPFHNYR